ncbi:MAG: hypothetical protein ISR45_02675 [Rhodospirillales bacterium]|nr:hypothetical protein [Rhodospirillales bacterium]
MRKRKRIGPPDVRNLERLSENRILPGAIVVDNGPYPLLLIFGIVQANFLDWFALSR